MTKNSHDKLRGNNRNRLTPLPFWAKFFDALLLMLPRRHRQVKLSPYSKIEQFNFDDKNFLAEDEPPTFHLTFADKSKVYGWFYLEAVLVRHTGNRLANLIIELDGNLKHFVKVPSNLRGTVREVVFIPKHAVRLYWQPSVSAGWFSQPTFLLTEISVLESFYRRAWRVWSDYFSRKHLLVNEAGCQLNLSNIIFNLKSAYEQSANIRINKQPKSSYELYIKNFDTLNIKDIDKNILALELKPYLSIIMSVSNPNVNYFKKTLDSIIVQRYRDWELCIAYDLSTDSEIQTIIRDYQKKDSRVKAVFCDSQGCISETANIAMSIACGDYFVLIDQEDLIPFHALFYVALEINHHPDVALIYVDEDKINKNDERYDPYFKSDWNTDLFYSQNYLGKLIVYKSELVKELGGFRMVYEGAQDYDLTLRVIAKISPHRIRHIPRILYHARYTADITAENTNLAFAHQAGIKALNNHLSGTDAYAESIKVYPDGIFRIRRPINKPYPLVSLIVATRDKVGLLEKCITSIQNKTKYPNYEIIIVDNQSKEKETLSYLYTFKDVTNVHVIHYDKPFNYSAINNFAVKQSHGEVIGLINNDIEVINEDWLTEMVTNAIRPEVGVVGAKLLYPDNTIQHAGVILGIGGMACHAHKYLDANDDGYFGRAIAQQEMSAVTAACMLLRKEVYYNAGMLDEENLTVAFNDVDFCLKVRCLGLKVIYTPFAILNHHESISRGQEDTPEKQKRQSNEMAFMRKKWGKTLDSDPYYNPNLSSYSADFSIKIN